MQLSNQIEIFSNNYLPSGDAFKAAREEGSNLRKLITGVMSEFLRMEFQITAMVDEWFPDTTETLISNWERTMGIPDDCFPVTSDLNERRENVIFKLAALGLQTSSDFEEFGLKLGQDIKVRSGIDHMSVATGGYGTELPVQAFSSVTLARNTIVVTEVTTGASFDYDFDFTFIDRRKIMLQCVIRNTIPAHCDLRFVGA